ncbi:hypothetical protein K6W16_24920 [Burkholderia dolosa]|uniref:Uncharacterized protein n=1 Tax=Burkholderia dolosa TaxID=152500 RepID=A0A892I0T3_9BURK|nr:MULTISPECIES: hypothetical protein [Burkholderia]AKE04150.1 membrane protein [Burkholderia cepacia]AJY13638.1 hypothetical protein AK34_1993 [Burkholderia dolosa AU0158]AYZ98921.1 hypothetical protein EGY28_29340 [Burkholderia dolosa]EAY69296.1 Major facilitator superfamily (MFS_1) transporter [Burkholderia dolosa AU0158]ETP65951.1 membrane protein [Burkholderia dolosa PC543]
MARTKTTRAAPAPGAGVIFALRAIGLVLLARWLFSMSQMGYRASLSAMVSSPWAFVYLVLIFLLLALPGAAARAERPFHPLPQWLRQALRFFALIGFLFAVWSIGAFAWAAGWRRVLHAVTTTNGWLVAAPTLYAAIVWICRPRPLWRTNVAARRFAVGRYAISLDTLTRTAIVWMESRKVGQYDARELSVRWPGHAAAGAGEPSRGQPAAVPPRRGNLFRRPKVELLWDSPAAVGHNRQIVMRAPLATEGDRVAVLALDAALKQIV